MCKLKYEDIPKIVKFPAYDIDLSGHYIRKWFEDEIGEGLEMNPDFQRGFCWSEQQQVKFVEYLLRGGKTHPIRMNNPQYFPNNNTTYSDFVMVDGLQRTTAILRFLRGEIKAFGYTCDKMNKSCFRYFTIRIEIYNIESKKEVVQWYLDLNTGGTIHKEKDLKIARDILESL